MHNYQIINFLKALVAGSLGIALILIISIVDEFINCYDLTCLGVVYFAALQFTGAILFYFIFFLLYLIVWYLVKKFTITSISFWDKLFLINPTIILFAPVIILSIGSIIYYIIFVGFSAIRLAPDSRQSQLMLQKEKTITNIQDLLSGYFMTYGSYPHSIQKIMNLAKENNIEIPDTPISSYNISEDGKDYNACTFENNCFTSKDHRSNRDHGRDLFVQSTFERLFVWYLRHKNYPQSIDILGKPDPHYKILFGLPKKDSQLLSYFTNDQEGFRWCVDYESKPQQCFTQKHMRDHIRDEDIKSIRWALKKYIDDAYVDGSGPGRYPESLSSLRSLSYTLDEDYNRSKFSDPLTQQPYAYTANERGTYQLCVVFETRPKQCFDGSEAN